MQTSNYIRLSDKKYPISFTQMRNEAQAVISRDASDETLADFGFANVFVSERPSGYNVREIAPVFNRQSGRWEQAFEVLPPTEEEIENDFQTKKNTALTELRQRRDADLARGFPYDFGEGNVHHIQLRDGDRANLTGLRIKADDAKDNGITDAIFNLRTFENVLIPVTPQQMIHATNAAFEGYMRIMSQVWALEFEILEAKNELEIPVIPETFARIE